MRGLPLLKKIGILIVILLVFIGYLQYKNYKENHFAVDKKKFNVKDSFAAVMASDYSNIPFLENADHYDIVDTLDKEVPLVNMRRDLRIEKVWLSMDNLYILTSFKLSQDDKSLDDIPEIRIGKLVFHRDNGKDFPYSTPEMKYGESGTLVQAPQGLERRTFNHRVYQSQVISMDFSGAFYGDEDYEKAINSINKVTLSDVKLVEKQKGKKKDKQTSVDDITIPISFNLDKYLVKTIPIHQELAINNSKIVFKSYELYFDHGALKYDIKGNSSPIEMTANFKLDGKGASSFDEENSKNIVYNTISLVDNPYNEIDVYNPDFKTVTIEPEQYSFMDTNKIEFTITKKQIKQLTEGKTHEIKVGNIKNGEIYFGVNGSIDYYGSFYLKFTNNNKGYPTVDNNMHFMVEQNFLGQSDENIKYMKATMPSISIENDKKKTLHTLQPEGIPNDGEEDKLVYGFYINPTEWDISKTFHITLKGLIYQDELKVDPVTISLKE